MVCKRPSGHDASVPLIASVLPRVVGTIFPADPKMTRLGVRNEHPKHHLRSLAHDKHFPAKLSCYRLHLHSSLWVSTRFSLERPERERCYGTRNPLPRGIKGPARSPWPVPEVT